MRIRAQLPHFVQDCRRLAEFRLGQAHRTHEGMQILDERGSYRVPESVTRMGIPETAGF
jgi:hypothetical protein